MSHGLQSVRLTEILQYYAKDFSPLVTNHSVVAIDVQRNAVVFSLSGDWPDGEIPIPVPHTTIPITVLMSLYRVASHSAATISQQDLETAKEYLRKALGDRPENYRYPV